MKTINFLTYTDAYTTNRNIIHKATYSVEYDKLTMSEGVDERRKIISVFNTVERLNKHPAAYLESLPEDSAYSSKRDREKGKK